MPIEQILRLSGSASFGAGPLSDPSGADVLVAAVRWLEGTLLGTVATVVAVIAVASVGLLMLTGRVSWRYGGRIVMGCFILFGASSIAAGIQAGIGAGAGAEPRSVPVSDPPPPLYPPAAVAPPASPPPDRADPFAGAALPSP